MLSFLRRRRPSLEGVFPESELIKPDCQATGSILFEEGMLNGSDSRFVLDWITNHSALGQVALNHSALGGGGYSSGDKHWRLELRDSLTNQTTEIRAKCVVNCAGVWADRVNEQFSIESPYKHRLSKGVFIGVRREEQHELPLVFDLGEHDDTFLYLPWGPVSLLGPTETPCATPEEGFRIDSADLDYLLGHANRRLHRQIDRPDIAMLRCGVRPLVVEEDYTMVMIIRSISRAAFAWCATKPSRGFPRMAARSPAAITRPRRWPMPPPVSLAKRRIR